MIDKEGIGAAVVTGAGSGVGRSVAMRLNKDGFKVALVGRDEGKLAATLAMLDQSDKCIICCADISVPGEVEAVAKKVLTQFGRVDFLANCAGINVPQRSINECSVEDYQRVLSVNLVGSFLMIKGFLPTMRSQGSGTIVNIVSDSGLRGNNFAGAAYISSKFGLRGLTETINAEERQNGIRATALYPGEINTPILDRRPQPPSQEHRAKMLQPEDIAQCVAMIAALPVRAIIEELVIRPAEQHWVSNR